MPVTYKKIATVTVTTATQAAIEFTSIPGAYTDLTVKLSLRAASSGINNATFVTLNGSTSDFTGIYLQGNGSTALSTTLARYVGQIPDATATASTFSNGEIYFTNYAGNTNKSFSIDNVQENNSATAGHALCQFLVGLWSNTSAITSIKIEPTATNFVQHSTATLYGIKKD